MNITMTTEKGVHHLMIDGKVIKCNSIEEVRAALKKYRATDFCIVCGQREPLPNSQYCFVCKERWL